MQISERSLANLQTLSTQIQEPLKHAHRAAKSIQTSMIVRTAKAAILGEK